MDIKLFVTQTNSNKELFNIRSVQETDTDVSDKLFPREIEPFSMSPHSKTINWEAIYSDIEPTTVGSELSNTIISVISPILPVEKIFVDEIGGVFCVWTIINEDNREVRRSIYEREGRIMERYPNLLFDFNLIIRRGRALDEIMSFEGRPVFERN